MVPYVSVNIKRGVVSEGFPSSGRGNSATSRHGEPSIEGTLPKPYGVVDIASTRNHVRGRDKVHAGMTVMFCTLVLIYRLSRRDGRRVMMFGYTPSS